MYCDKNNYYSVLYISSDDEENQSKCKKREKIKKTIYCYKDSNKKIFKKVNKNTLENYFQILNRKINRIKKNMEKINKNWLKVL